MEWLWLLAPAVFVIGIGALLTWVERTTPSDPPKGRWNADLVQPGELDEEE